MEYKEIDQMFDSLLERVETKDVLKKGAYDTDPLSQDHFLLKKSWAYFKEKIRVIEEQYEQRLEARKQEVRALAEEIKIYKEANDDLEKKNGFLNAFQETFVRSRSIDLMDFQKAQEKLKDVWEEERSKLENKIQSLEEGVYGQKRSGEKMAEANRDREHMLQMSIDGLREKLLHKAQEENEKIKEFNVRLIEKEEVIQNRELKIELLRGELGRTGEIVNKLKEEISLWEKRADSLINKVEEQSRELDAQRQRNDQLSFKIETLEREKDEIKKSWMKEESSWRELWDRLQSFQERRKT